MMNFPFQYPVPQQLNRQTGVNPQQFQQWLPQINNNIITQLAAQARQQGISEQDIQAGLNFINHLRSRG